MITFERRGYWSWDILLSGNFAGTIQKTKRGDGYAYDELGDRIYHGPMDLEAIATAVILREARASVARGWKPRPKHVVVVGRNRSDPSRRCFCSCGTNWLIADNSRGPYECPGRATAMTRSKL